MLLLVLLYLTFVASLYAFAPLLQNRYLVKTSSKSLKLQSSNSFSLPNYIKSNVWNEGTNPINVVTLNDLDDDSTDNKTSYILLLDLSVRSFDDILDLKASFLPRFVNKLKSSNQAIVLFT